MDPRVHRLEFWEEAIGDLYGVKQEEGHVLASIGPVVIILPFELGAKIRPHIGSRIGILRTENDYRVKVFPAAKTGNASKGKLIAILGTNR